MTYMDSVDYYVRWFHYKLASSTACRPFDEFCLYAVTYRRDLSIQMAPQKLPWDRLVRFVSATDNTIHYGEPIVDKDQEEKIAELAKKGNLKVTVFTGSDPASVERTDKTDTAKSLLGPIEAKNTPIMRCIGLNYKSHSTRKPVECRRFVH